jgi:hypothetical protein
MPAGDPGHGLTDASNYRAHDRREPGTSAGTENAMAAVSTPAARNLLTALFDDPQSAELAYQACVDRGYEVGQVNVFVSEGTRQRLLKSHDEIQAELAKREAEGGELGGPKGGRVGILMTIFAAVGAAVAIPTVGFVAGPLAIALTAAGAAGVAAGLVSALSDWGVPADRIRQYESGIKHGAILVAVEARTDRDVRELQQYWTELGGREIHYR